MKSRLDVVYKKLMTLFCSPLNMEKKFSLVYVVKSRGLEKRYKGGWPYRGIVYRGRVETLCRLCILKISCEVNHSVIKPGQLIGIVMRNIFRKLIKNQL